MTYGLVLRIIGGLVGWPLGGTLGALLGVHCGGCDYPSLIDYMYLKKLDDNQRENLAEVMQRLDGSAEA